MEICQKLIKIIVFLKWALNKSLSKRVLLSIDHHCLRESIFRFGKNRIKIFIQSIDPCAWTTIIKGPFIPTKEVNGELVPNE